MRRHDPGLIDRSHAQLAGSGLIPPFGGQLKELVADAGEVPALKAESVNRPCWDLTPRQLFDIELLLNGAFSPLEGYLDHQNYESVCAEMRLIDRTLWPMPICLDVTEEFGRLCSRATKIALRHPEGMVIAVLTVTDVWMPDRIQEAATVFGTTDETHPGVFHLKYQTNPVYIGGALQGVEYPPHHTFKHLRHTPRQLRDLFRTLGWDRVVAFQTRNPMHRAHVELTKRAAALVDANVLIHPVVGRTSPGDVDYFVRVRCYEALLKYYPATRTVLSLLPLAMRMAGPREALWHAIIRQNFGCTHFIVGRNHAGPAKDANGEDFYAPYSAQELLRIHEPELGIRVVPFEEMVYVEDFGRYLPQSEVTSEARILTLSGTELRRYLREGLEVPSWFSFPEVIAALKQSYPPRSHQGFTVFFTGLSGAGKSTIANILVAKLMEIGTRPVTILDGDIVRRHLSNELGFSKEHRDINVRRIGFVASEITKNRGIAVCAPIAPYASTRREVREIISQYGGFIEVYMATPLEVCEARDRKGVYARARAGMLKNLTGIDDPYEAPLSPEILLDTSDRAPEDCAEEILRYLTRMGFLSP